MDTEAESEQEVRRLRSQVRTLQKANAALDLKLHQLLQWKQWTATAPEQRRVSPEALGRVHELVDKAEDLEQKLRDSQEECVSLEEQLKSLREEKSLLEEGTRLPSKRLWYSPSYRGKPLDPKHTRYSSLPYSGLLRLFSLLRRALHAGHAVLHVPLAYDAAAWGSRDEVDRDLAAGAVGMAEVTLDSVSIPSVAALQNWETSHYWSQALSPEAALTAASASKHMADYIGIEYLELDRQAIDTAADAEHAGSRDGFLEQPLTFPKGVVTHVVLVARGEAEVERLLLAFAECSATQVALKEGLRPLLKEKRKTHAAVVRYTPLVLQGGACRLSRLTERDAERLETRLNSRGGRASLKGAVRHCVGVVPESCTLKPLEVCALTSAWCRIINASRDPLSVADVATETIQHYIARLYKRVGSAYREDSA